MQKGQDTLKKIVGSKKNATAETQKEANVTAPPAVEQKPVAKEEETPMSPYK